jgi:sulfur carrier protein
MIDLQVNGSNHNCDSHTSLSDLLAQMGLNPQMVAVEYNGEILPRQVWAETIMQPDDRLEIVTIVGGG